jgi:NADH-quinone oxidoreductase subunit A
VLEEYAFIGVFLVVSGIFSVLPLLLARLLRPKKPNPHKTETYECGMQTYGKTWVRFKAQYYTFALAFVVLEVEAVFLLPWALVYQQLELYAVVEAVLFILILLGALIYIWRKGELEWM